MSYLTQEIVINAITNMNSFHKDIQNMYSNYGMNILDNLGRRNIIMSQVQEKFFADELKKHYKGVFEDGRTGQPDIVIGEINKELECKLTSRNKNGSINFN